MENTKLKCLNVGCGRKYHKDWVNIDMAANTKDVISVNLLKGIPFPDNSFDIVYHSQVLEHFPKDKASFFMKECFRVLKSGGIIRVVVPDLENIVDEYKRFLDEITSLPNPISEANYDWILLEMYDQTVRNYSGGQMAEYLRSPVVINSSYVNNRIGYVASKINEEYLNEKKIGLVNNSPYLLLKSLKRKIVVFFNSIRRFKFSKRFSIGNFRLGGEVHMWMYDRYSLSRLLVQSGFDDVIIQSPYKSSIPGWSKFELDVKDDFVYDPSSLFIEARK